MVVITAQDTAMTDSLDLFEQLVQYAQDNLCAGYSSLSPPLDVPTLCQNVSSTRMHQSQVQPSKKWGIIF